jgi:tetratricopeptide (TPR) repeat protein
MSKHIDHPESKSLSLDWLTQYRVPRFFVKPILDFLNEPANDGLRAYHIIFTLWAWIVLLAIITVLRAGFVQGIELLFIGTAGLILFIVGFRVFTYGLVVVFSCIGKLSRLLNKNDKHSPQYESGEQSLSKLVKTARKALESGKLSKADIAATHKRLGDAFYELAKLEYSKQHLEQAVKDYQQALDYYLSLSDETVECATLYSRLAKTFRDLKQVDRAIENWQKAQQLWMQVEAYEIADQMSLYIQTAQECQTSDS